MDVASAQMIWAAIGAYFTAGALTALLLQLGGLKRIDPLAWSAPLQVKLLITPGLIALWPVMLAKLVRGRRA